MLKNNIEINKKLSKPKKAIIILLLSAAAFIIAMLIYFNIYYHAVDVADYLESDAEVSIEKTDKGYFFDGPGTENALIFYQGSKVETEAYAPLMYELAEQGVDCFLVDMPFRMAFFGMNSALEIEKEYESSYDTWILSGHSLGGAMAANLAADNPDNFYVLFLLAAYPTKSLENQDISVITVYGSEDGVLNMEKIEDGRELMPSDYTEIVIEGGNHAQFGSYGEQSGDGIALISAEEQRKQTEAALLSILDTASKAKG